MLDEQLPRSTFFTLPSSLPPSPFAELTLLFYRSPVVNMSSVDAQALGALKATMGITFTTWAPATFCTVAPTAIVAGTWDGVQCNSFGKAVALAALALALAIVCFHRHRPSRFVASASTCRVGGSSAYRFPASPLSTSLPLACVCPTLRLVLQESPQQQAHGHAVTCHLQPRWPHRHVSPPPACPPAWPPACPPAWPPACPSACLPACPLFLYSNLDYNWFSGSVPAFMLTLPSLTDLSVGYNYLTGALPPVTSPLSSVNVQFNFLAGTFPTLTLILCAARMNCFLDATKCKNPARAAELPRATAACTICNTTNAQGRLCNGGVCIVNATDLVALGAPNSAASPSLPLICTGAAFVAMDTVHAGAMLNLKASLGVTFSDWKADSPCSLPDGVAAVSWSGVSCDGTGKLLSIVLNAQRLAGSIHSGISKLTTLTLMSVLAPSFCHLSFSPPLVLTTLHFAPCTLSLLSVAVPCSDLQSNLLQGRLDSFVAAIKAPLVLKELALQFNYLSGQFPSTLLALTTLSKLSVLCTTVLSALSLAPHHPSPPIASHLSHTHSLPSHSCLSFPCPSSVPTHPHPNPPLPSHALPCSLPPSSVAYNYLTGTFPAVPASAKSVDVQSNFLSDAFPTNTLTYCAATSNCLIDASKCASLGISQRTADDCAICGTTSSQGTLCGGVACLVNTTGVTATPTATSPPLNLYCTPVAMDTNTTTTLLALKAVLGVTSTDWAATTVVLQPKALRSASVPMATTVGACTVEGQTPAPGSWTGVFCNSAGAIVSLALQYNWFSSSIPSALLALPALSTVSKLNRNYLTGVVPAVGAAVKALNVAGNFLSGSFPTAALTACNARSNCFVDATKCANTNGTAQRASADCNVCFSSGAAGALCGGGFCMPDATVPAGTATPNTEEGHALLPMFYQGAPIEINMRGAMLNLKASLGVTFTDWAAASPCTIAGQSPVVGAWSKVVCDTAGKVISIDLTSQLLKGRMHADITKFTTLTSL
ncbi:unnamed protein product [Closterium sp. Naga37s-1]|nr:unnamed protein product [Closterium sp. Naga37s-1]